MGKLMYLAVALVAVFIGVFKSMQKPFVDLPKEAVAGTTIGEDPEYDAFTHPMYELCKLAPPSPELCEWLKLRIMYKKEGAWFVTRVIKELFSAKWFQMTKMEPLRKPAAGEVEIFPSGAEGTHHYMTEKSTGIPHVWHYYVGGPEDGEPVIMVHGMLQTTYCFYYQFDALVKGGKHRVYNFDMKGFGHSSAISGDYRWFSQAEQLLNVLDTIGLDKFNVVCHDRGCVMLDYLVARHSERVLRYSRGQQFLDFVELDRSPQGKAFATAKGCNMFADPVVIGVGSSMATYNAIPTADFVRSQQEWQLNPEGGCKNFASSIFAKDVSDRQGPDGTIANMNVPVQLLYGDHDLGQPRYYYDSGVVFRFPNARLAFIPDAMHFTTLENPSVYSDLVVSFLNTPVAQLWKEKPTNFNNMYWPGGSFDPNALADGCPAGQLNKILEADTCAPGIPMRHSKIFPLFPGNRTEMETHIKYGEVAKSVISLVAKA